MVYDWDFGLLFTDWVTYAYPPFFVVFDTFIYYTVDSFDEDMGMCSFKLVKPSVQSPSTGLFGSCLTRWGPDRIRHFPQTEECEQNEDQRDPGSLENLE